MTCYSPITGWRTGDGRVVFNPSEGFVDREVTIRCGRCIGCRVERSRQWAVRLMHEKQTSSSASFLTLTYSDDNLPPYGGLVLEHWQKFIRALRKKTGKKLRYYHCGEYGEQTWRPHYHAILYGEDFKDRIRHCRTDTGDWLYVSDLLGSCWPHGHHLVGDVTFESAQYVAGYVTKKLNGDRASVYDVVDPVTGEVHSRKPPYATMSRKPGIGHDWFVKYGNQVYPRDEVIVNAHVTQPPKFYDGRLELLDPTAYLEVKRKRKERLRNQADYTPERLAVREQVTRLKLKVRDMEEA